jgi:hypothetical protein
MSVFIGFRCPSKLAKEIAAKSEATGQTKTAVMLELMSGMPSFKMTDRSKLPELEAIYLVWTNERLLYIGQAVNLKKRFKQHHRLADFFEHEAKISWFPAQELDKLEIEELY